MKTWRRTEEMGNNHHKCIIVLLALLLFPVIAVGQFVTITVDAEKDGDSSVATSRIITTDIDMDDVLANPTTEYNYREAGINLMSDGGVSLGVVDVNLTIEGDPFVLLDFSVTTGIAVAFTFTSQLETFDALMNCQAYAYASIGVSTDGAYVYGGQSAGKAFRTLYNGTLWNDILPTPLAGQGTYDDSVGYEAIPGIVSSMQSQFKFTLTENALASGSSYYEIIGDYVPEPATIALLGLGGLLLRKRKK